MGSMGSKFEIGLASNNRANSIKRCAALGLAAALLASTPLSSFFVSSAEAATLTWRSPTVGVGDSWNAIFSGQTNWSGNDRPDNGDSLIFGNHSFNTSTNTFSDIDLRNITFSSSLNATHTIGGNQIDMIAVNLGDGIKNDNSRSMFINNALSLQGSTAITFKGASGSGNALFLNGNITNNADMRIVSGNVFLGGSNGSMNGDIFVEAGRIFLGTGNALSSVSNVDLSSGAALDFEGTAEDFGSLSGDSGSSVQLNDGATMRVGFNDDSTTFGGSFRDDSGAEGSIEKAGTGTFTLTGSSTSFRGDVSITGGTIRLDGGNNFLEQGSNSFSNTTSVSIASGTTLDMTNDFEEFGGISGSGTVKLGSTGHIMVGHESSNFVGSITGSGGQLTVTDGFLSLVDATSSYGGGTTIEDGGTLRIRTASNLGGGTLTFDDGTLQFVNSPSSALTLAQTVELESGGGTIFASANTINLNGKVSGDGGLTIQGGRTVKLRNFSNDYSGETRIEGSTLVFDGGSRASHNSGVSIDNTGKLVVNGSNTVSYLDNSSSESGANITLNGNLTIDHDGSDKFFSGTITGTGSLTKTGSGYQGLSGTNTYNGDTFLNGGLLAVSSDDRLGNTSGDLIFNGGGLRAFGTFSTSRDVTINSGGGTFDVAGFQSLSLNTNLTGTGTLTKSDSGSLFLNGNNENFTGQIDVTRGRLELGSGNALSASTTVNVGSLGTLDFNNTGESFGSLIGSGNVDLTGSSAIADVLYNGSTVKEFSGVISGSGGRFWKSGSGTQVLSGTNSYSGGTTINAGVLSISSNRNLGSSSGSLTFNGGTLRVTDNITGSGRMNRTTTLNGDDGTFDVVTGKTLEANGTISGSGGLIKTGGGTLTLNNTGNSYSGWTFLNGGTISVASNSSLGAANGLLVFNGGALQTTSTISDMNRTTVLRAGGGTLNVNSGTTLTQTGVLRDTSNPGPVGGLTKTGSGTLVLNGNNTYSGGTTINGGVVQISNNAKLGAGNGSLSFNGGTLRTTGNITGGGSMNRFTTLNGSGTFDVATGTTLTQHGQIGGSGQLVKAGGFGTLVLNGTNFYQGGTNFNRGIIQVSRDANLGRSDGTLIFTGGSLWVTETFTMNRASFGGSIEVASGKKLTQHGVIGGNALGKSGDGTLILTADNTYTDFTFLGGGVLEVFKNSNLGADNAELRFSGGTLRTTGNIDGVNSMDRQTTLFSAGGTFDVAASTLKQEGDISGVGGLTKTGSGRLILRGFNSYTGGTTVSGGTLWGDTDSIQGNVTNNAAVVFGQGTIGTYSGTISGSGSVTKFGVPGTVTLDGDNTYTGETFVNEGTLAIAGTNKQFKSSRVNIAAGAKLDLSGRSSLDDFSSNLVNGGRIENGANSQTLAGDLINQGVVNGGAGGLMLAGDVTGGGNYEGDVAFLKSFGPGNSPDLITGENITFGTSNLLLMELGGLGRGTQYDAFDISGALTFGGTLDIGYINGFGSSIALSDTFDLFNFDPFQAAGTFANIILPTLMSGWMWDISGLYDTGIIFVAEATGGEGVPGPGAVFILVVGLAGFAGLRRKRTA